MSIVNGQQASAADFILESTGASGKVATSDSNGKISFSFLPIGSNGSNGAGTYDGTTTVNGVAPSAGVYTINVGAVKVYILNHTSFAVTGTAKIVFSNPHANGTIVIIKFNNGCTITSSTVPCIDVSSMGAAAGNNGNTNCRVSSSGGALTLAQSTGTAGGTGQNYSGLPFGFIFLGCGAGGQPGTHTSFGGARPGGPGGAASVSGDGTAGTNGSSTSGNSSTATEGTGGIGGGALLIIGDGAINFTGTIYAKGSNGGNPTNGGGTNDGASAGSAGAGGSIAIIGDSITANTGTLTVTAGTAGTSFSNCGSPGTSANGYSFVGTKASVY